MTKSFKFIFIIFLSAMFFLPSQINANANFAKYTYEDYLEERGDRSTEKEKASEKNYDNLKQGFMIILIFAILIFVLYSWKKSNNKTEIEKKKQEEKERLQEVQRRKKVQEEIEKRYPEFTSEGLKQFVQYILVHLQKAVEDKDFDKLKAMESDELYTTHSTIVENLGTNKQCTRQQNVLSIVTQAFLTGAEDSILLDVYVEFIEYYYDQIQMKIIRGNDHTIQKRVYNLELVHETSLQSNMYSTCPNCGAPIELTEQGHCAYCHSLLQKKISSWLVNTYKTI